MGCENTTGKKINRISATGFFIIYGRAFKKKVLPEIRCINAPVFDGRQQSLIVINIVNRKKTGYPKLSCYGRDQSRHPVIAMNQIRLNAGDNGVDHLPLEG